MPIKSVTCNRTGKTYSSIKEASKDLEVSYQHLRNQLCNPGDHKHLYLSYSEPDPLTRLTKPELIEMIKELRSSLSPE